VAHALLSPEFLARLERLELTTRKMLSGRLKGERRSKRRGSSSEFIDHKPYVEGDDLRFIDWNVMIRLDRLFVKLFEEEQDVHFHVLIDASQSMDFGDPKKIDFAKKVAAALAFVGLRNNDRVVASSYGDDLGAATPALRGRHAFWRVAEFLDKLQPTDGSNLAAACKKFALRHPGKGVVVVVSDLMDKHGFEAGLRYLIAKQMDIYLLHVLAAEEINPPMTGDLRLVDAEDGDVAEVTVSAPLLARYKANLNAYCAAAKDFCARRNIVYMFADNRVPFETLIFNWMRKRGLLQ
jgi:uncharacterized protein (DUF58 family)